MSLALFSGNTWHNYFFNVASNVDLLLLGISSEKRSKKKDQSLSSAGDNTTRLEKL